MKIAKLSISFRKPEGKVVTKNNKIIEVLVPKNGMYEVIMSSNPWRPGISQGQKFFGIRIADDLADQRVSGRR